MLKDLLTGRIPDNLDCEGVNLTRPNWEILRVLWNNNTSNDVKFTVFEHPQFGISWKISEKFSDGLFEMSRSQLSLQRNTMSDKFGLLGLSLINPKDDRVILTEGVSDYFTAKLLNPKVNVLGVTTLSGSSTAKKILLSLFNSLIICADNDANADRNTGVNNALFMKKFFEGYGKSVKIFLPQTPHKDITDNFIFNLKLSLNGTR